MGIAVNNPNKLLAYDTILQTEGNLDAPKALPLGGNWAEAGKTGAEGFKVIGADDNVQRAKVSDANLQAGSYAIAGSEEPTTSRASVDVKASTAVIGEPEPFRRGVFLRYKDTNNWLMAVLSTFDRVYVLQLIKRVGG